MDIHITSGIGTGPTKLAAFDSALNHGGVANYNLIILSSIIPPKTKIIDSDKPLKNVPGQWGDKLYVVKADMRVDTPNTEAWAGIGWVQDKKTGKGLFVEHTGHSRQSVENDIKHTLEAMMATRNIDFGQIEMRVAGRTCTHEPICALVIAVYQSDDWKKQK